MPGVRRSEMLRSMITQATRTEATSHTAAGQPREGVLLEPGDIGWDAARRAFNLAVDQRPALVALPLDVVDVVDAVRAARERGLRVVPQSRGHRAQPALDDAMLLRTTALADVEIDARAHRARVRAGARWADVIDRASLMGLAPAAGFSRTAGVVGDLLGDGMGWLARRHGVAARSVLAVEFVTADGDEVRADDFDVPAGSVITAVELALHPADDLYAGALFFPFGRAAEVLGAWREWTATAPAETTSIARVMRFADRHDVPEMVRGRSYTVIEAAHLGTDGAPLEPLRALRPELDTCSLVPASALGHLHLESEHPEARLADDGLVGELPAAAIDDLLAVAGVGGDRDHSPLTTVELRHASGALETLERGFFTHAAGTPTDAASATAIEAQLALVAGALAPYGAVALNP
jgi:hypothetical protein